LRDLVRLIAAGLLLLFAMAACGGGDAQPEGGITHHIGFLSASSSPSFIEALKDGLQKQGYREGKNLQVDWEVTKDENELPALAAELVSSDVELIIAGGTRAVEAAKAATADIPIVMTNSGDAVKTGLVASLQKPGGNITGLTQISPLLTPKRLELMKEAFPRNNKVAVIWNPEHPTTQLSHQELVDAAPGLGIELISLPTKQEGEIAAVFASAASSGAGSTIVLRDPFMVKNESALISAADANKLPAMYETINFVESGGLMLYGPSFEDLYARCAVYVAKILKGAAPAELPVEQPKRFELVINMKTARASGFTIADSVLRRADRLIE
jgi:putative tryptophan/tyrosine transport system substrate-binding protein